MPNYTGVIGYIYDFQTLITGVAAVGAALWATRFGRRQTRLATRDLLINRTNSIAMRRNEISKLMQEVRNMERHLRPWEDEIVEPTAIWAHDAHQTIGLIVATLQVQQDTSLDGRTIDVKRKNLIASCDLLSACLADIHAVQSVDFGGFEEPPLSAKPAYEGRATKAADELKSRLSEVLDHAAKLDEASDARLAEVRRELQKLERFALRR